MAVVIDSYSESNHDTNRSLNATTTGRAQSFTARSNAVFTQAKLYLKKTGSPTGDATIKLYAHSGTYGTSSIPTGSALDSVTYAVSSLTTSYQLITFDFSGGYNLVQGTYYVLAIEYSSGDASNNVQVGTDTSSPGHGGNTDYYSGGSWNADSSQDHCFYIYGTLSKTETLTDNFNDNSLDSVKWGSYTDLSGSVSETNQRLEMTCANSTDNSWAGIYSKSSYDMTGSYAFCEILDGTGGDTYLDLSINLAQIPNTTNYISIGVDTGTGKLEAFKKIAGIGTTMADATFDPVLHKWIRLREDGGTTYWEYSATGTAGSWTVLHSESNPIAITDIYVILDDFEYNSTTPGTHILDEFNIIQTSVNNRVSTLNLMGVGN